MGAALPRRSRIPPSSSTREDDDECDVDASRGGRRGGRSDMAQPPTSRGEPCGFVSGLELAIRYSIPYLEGSHDPDMMSEVVPRFEPFERCCMVILFVGGRGKTTPHPKSPPLLR